MPDQEILAENSAQLERLERLAERTDLLDQVLENGWTVAVALAHLAFWDRRVARLLERWERTGEPPDNVDDDLINASLLDEWKAIPPVEAARLAINAALEVNRAVESMSDAVAAAAMTSGNQRLINRALHRREHLDEIGV